MQELRGDIAHWPKTGWVRNRLARPTDRMLSYMGIIGLCIRCNNIEVRTAFWHVMHFIRQIPYDANARAQMFTGQLSGLLPLRRALPGLRHSIPILRTSGGETLTRLGGINWRKREFFAEDPNELIEPPLGLRPEGRISVFEYLVDIGTMRLRGGDGAEAAVVNLTDNMSSLSWIDGGRILAGPPSRHRLTFRRELIRRQIKVR